MRKAAAAAVAVASLAIVFGAPAAGELVPISTVARREVSGSPPPCAGPDPAVCGPNWFAHGCAIDWLHARLTLLCPAMCGECDPAVRQPPEARMWTIVITPTEEQPDGYDGLDTSSTAIKKQEVASRTTLSPSESDECVDTATSYQCAKMVSKEYCEIETLAAGCLKSCGICSDSSVQEPKSAALYLPPIETTTARPATTPLPTTATAQQATATATDAAAGSSSNGDSVNGETSASKGEILTLFESTTDGNNPFTSKQIGFMIGIGIAGGMLIVLLIVGVALSRRGSREESDTTEYGELHGLMHSVTLADSNMFSGERRSSKVVCTFEHPSDSGSLDIDADDVDDFFSAKDGSYESSDESNTEEINVGGAWSSDQEYQPADSVLGRLGITSPRGGDLPDWKITHVDEGASEAFWFQ